ncbi:hypothetical protein F2Q69_00023569 [Brassica cretica]|uniref:Uncharacterized protein n=1 Tax=Brassica cretica TaxID=69181 RepID=A0A8S9QB63_BRACR|nr:hypothetical protein F2Q69_00023569 [Brassica cretica]
MDPNQTVRTQPSRVNDIDPTGSDSGTKTLPAGPMGADGAIITTQKQRAPPIGTSSQDRFSPIDQTSIPDRTSIPERSGARVWNRPGERQSADDLTRTTRPISPTPLAQTREEVTELRGMVSSLIDETRSQKIAYQTIANRLDQAERGLAEHRVNARERNQTPPDPLRGTSNPQNTGLFCTPEIPSARSGRYTGDNSQRPPQQSVPLAKPKLQRAGRNRYRTTSPKKYSDPIRKQTYGKTRGA